MRFINYSDFYQDVKQIGLEAAAKRSQRLGFGGVEFLDLAPLRENSPLNKTCAAETKKILDAYGQSVACFSVAVNLLDPMADGYVDTLWRQIEFAAELGSDKFHHTIGLTWDRERALSTPYQTALDIAFPRARLVAERCASYGMTCLYEPQGYYFNGTDGLGRFYAQMKQEFPNIGICGDVGNCLFAETPATAIYDAFASDIRHVHIKDYLVFGTQQNLSSERISRGGKYLYHCPVGEGVTDFSYCFQKLKEVGYDGDVAFEFEGDDDEIRRVMAFVSDLWKENLK